MSIRPTGRRRALRRQSPSLPTVTPSSAAAHWLKVATLFLTAVFLLGLFSTQIADTDFWWHLKTGQYIVEHHALAVPDKFAYSTSGAAAYRGEESVRHFNLTHEWLSQVLMYAVYSVAGFPGIVLVRSVLLASVCGLAGFLAARMSANFYAGVAAACATASVLVAFTADRPGVVTFLGVAVFVVLLELRPGWWALPPIAMLWSNCHGGFLLGWVVLLAYAVETVLLRRRLAFAPENRRFWLVMFGAIAASVFNPNGFAVVSTVFAYRQSPMMANLIEWQSPKLWGAPYGFDILLYAATLVLVFSWRRVRPAHWILFAAFAWASLTAFRNIPLIGFLAPVLIAVYSPLPLAVPKRFAWAPAILAATGAAAVFAHGNFSQLRVAAWTVPEGAADFLLEHHITGPMFNTYEQGGYLIWRTWPQERVFIDGRALSETVYREYHQILFNAGSSADQVTGPREELLNRYGIQVVVMNTMDFVSGAMYPLALALANPITAEWELVYDDSQSVIFLRRPRPDISALSNKLGRVLRHMDRECAAYVENSADSPLCAGTLAAYWLENQSWDAARRMLVLYLSHAQRRDQRAERALRDLDAAHPITIPGDMRVR